MVLAVLAVCVVALWPGPISGAPEPHVILQQEVAQDTQGILNNPQQQLFQEILGLDGESTRDARRAGSFPSYKGKPTACVHRGKNIRGVCLQLQECYPFFRLSATSEAWRFGIYDTCVDLREGVEEYGVCCVQEEPEVDNLVEPQRYDADDQIILDESMVPGLMNRGHVEYRPVNQNLTRRPTIKGPSWPREDYPVFPGHPTHPPLPTHPPSITNQPWWNPTPGPVTRPPWEQTTQNPIAVVTLPTKSTIPPWQQPVTWWKPETPSTTIATTPRAPPTTAAVAPTTGSSTFGNPCSAHSFYIAGDAEAQAVWEDFYNMSSRVVGGFPSRRNSHPWLATLFNGAKQFCGGSLIDKTHILTAAHCIAHMSSVDVSRLKVRLGAHNIRGSESSTQEFKVKKVVRHKDYDARKLYNDVAMLTLDREVQFNNYVRPICLASGGSWVNDIATVAGWGSLYEGGPQPGALHEVKLRVWSLTRCGEYYGTAAPGGIVPSYICAGDGGKDSCMGDSGGPLVIKQNGVWTQIGIVSWGIGCGKGNYPGVYSRLPTFLGWINRVKSIYR